MSTTDWTLFGAALCALSALWIRHEIASHRRRKETREMWQHLRRSGHVAALLLCAMGAASGQELQTPCGLNSPCVVVQSGITYPEWSQRRVVRLSAPVFQAATTECNDSNFNCSNLTGPQWEPPKPGPLCGQRFSTAQTNDIRVACVNFDALAKLGVSGVYGRQMQVLVVAKHGTAVRVEAFYTDAEGKEASVIQWADLRKDAQGNLVAMPVFDGWNYTRVVVRALRDSE